MKTNHLGKRLQELRKKRRLRSNEFATVIGVEPSTYSRIENGSRHIKVEQLNKLADFLKISHNEIHSVWLADKIFEIIEKFPTDIKKGAVSIVYKHISSTDNEAIDIY